MARSHGKVSTGLWNDPRLRSLPEDARNLFIYLCSSPHSNAAGCYVASLPSIADDLQWGIERVSEGFRNLSERPFATYDKSARVVFLPGWWDENPLENANVAQHAAKLLLALPDCASKFNAFNKMREYAGHNQHAQKWLKEHYPQPLANPSERVPEPSRNPEPEPEPDIPPTEDAGASSESDPLKSRIWGPALGWLCKATKQPESKIRPMVGKWCSEWGDGRTLEAIEASSKNAPLAPIPYINKILKAPRNARTDPETSFRQQLAAIAAATDLGDVEAGRPGATSEKRFIGADRDADSEIAASTAA